MKENLTDDRKLKSSSKTQEESKKVYFKRRKGCPLSGPDAPEISYKNPLALAKFISEGGRILPSRVTNVSASNQRLLKKQIKVARILALLPFVSSFAK